MFQIRLTSPVDVTPQRREVIAAALREHVALTRAAQEWSNVEGIPGAAIAGRLRVAKPFPGRLALHAHHARTDPSVQTPARAGVAGSIRAEEVAP